MSTNGSDGRSLRDRIFAIEDVRSEIVEVPEWEAKLEVRSMTGRERAGMMERFMTDEGELDVKELYPSLLIACVFDPETGDKVFGPDDHDRLNERNAAALERLAQASMRLSGMTEASAGDLGKASSPPVSDVSTST